jgi:hypothetical protein
MYGFANALRYISQSFAKWVLTSQEPYREAFAPDLPVAILAAHKFLKSINNTTIERGWLRLRLQWGDNVILFWESGQDLFDPLDHVQE